MRVGVSIWPAICLLADWTIQGVSAERLSQPHDFATNGPLYESSLEGPIFNDDEYSWPPWRLWATLQDSGQYQHRMTLANGYIGINLAALGPFFEGDISSENDLDEWNDYNGWPLYNKRQSFATVAGFYDANDYASGTNYPWLAQYGGDSFISGLPHWSGLIVKVDGKYQCVQR